MTADKNTLRSRMTKLEALFARAGTPGERSAAGAAIERLKKRFTKNASDETEMQLSLPDMWSVKLFLAVCRKHEINPYRYARQRRTTVMVNASTSFVQEVVWPEFTALQKELETYFEETVDHLITTAMGSDGDDSNIETARLPG